MITVYFQNETAIQSVLLTNENQSILQNALWIDMLSPTLDEEKIIEQSLKINIPTKQEMEEIELSSRLYEENSTLFMTTSVVAYADFPISKTDIVTFILLQKTLITVRYSELNAFKVFIREITKVKRMEFDSAFLFLGILNSLTERVADILEKISRKLDEASQLIFHQDINATNDNINYKNTLETIGVQGDLGTKVRESIVSLSRLISFLEQEAELSENLQARLKIIKNDIQALSDYTGFISTKVSFLLDATLGMINIEQNNIIKIFSIAAVIFLPPTLIASFYGMNFKYMPELNWFFGYPFAMVLMILSAIFPYLYFKKKKWV